MLVGELLIIPQPYIRIVFPVLRSTVVDDKDKQVVVGCQLFRQGQKHKGQRLFCGRIVHIIPAVTVEVDRRGGESSGVCFQHVFLRVSSITHQHSDVPLGHPIGLAERAVEEGTVVPIAFMIGELVAPAVDEHGIQMLLARALGPDGCLLQ